MLVARLSSGTFRSLKNKINIGLFILVLLLPFIEIGGHPLVLFDIPNRSFEFFGLIIWPQDFYFLHIILLLLGFMLFFFTALLGRVWCAYACPQTIFVEIYNWIGRTIGGLTFGKKTETLFVRYLVIFVWILFSLFLGFVFVSYFITPKYFIHQIIYFQIYTESGNIATWFIFWLIISIFSFVAFSYLRENVCKYICPYGRFQTILLDKHSPVVSYDAQRGEPRRTKGNLDHTGDCTSCNLCLLVCPTGIDIREGMQVACIRCGLCIDACSHEMERINKKTLIDLKTTQQSLEGQNTPIKYFRFRTVIYGTVISLLLSLFIFLLYIRKPIYVNVLRDKAMISTFIPSIGYQNMYEIHLGNMSYNSLQVKMKLLTDDNSNFIFLNTEDLYTLKSKEYKKVRVIVSYKTELDSKKGNQKIKFEFQDTTNLDIKKIVETYFLF